MCTPICWVYTLVESACKNLFFCLRVIILLMLIMGVTTRVCVRYDWQCVCNYVAGSLMIANSNGNVATYNYLITEIIVIQQGRTTKWNAKLGGALLSILYRNYIRMVG